MVLIETPVVADISFLDNPCPSSEQTSCTFAFESNVHHVLPVRRTTALYHTILGIFADFRKKPKKIPLRRVLLKGHQGPAKRQAHDRVMRDVSGFFKDTGHRKQNYYNRFFSRLTKKAVYAVDFPIDKTAKISDNRNSYPNRSFVSGPALAPC
jgi:hypothetical protein